MLNDVRLALRTIGRRPAFAAVAVVTLALGIGANVAVFSVVRGVLLRPLPYPEEGRLVGFWYHSQGRRTSLLSQPELLDLRSKVDALEGVAGLVYRRLHLGTGEEPRLVRAIAATPELLPLLGITPAAGRVFAAAEALPGGPDVVVISDSLSRQLVPAGEAVGAAVTLAGKPHEVIGVMPPGFAFPAPDVDVYMPFRMNAASPDLRNNHYLLTVGRLKPGVSVEKARAEVAAYGRWAVARYPEFYSGFNASLELTTLRDTFVEPARAPLLLVLGAVSLVLLIACANVAHLLLARSEERRRETAVRLALGASPRHLARQLVAEGLVLAALAAAGALVLAEVGLRAFLALTVGVLPRAESVSLDGAVLAYAMAVSLATVVLSTLAPLVRAFRRDPRADLQSGVRNLSATPAGQSFRRTLVAVQVALTVVLTAGASLVTRSILQLLVSDVGFDTDRAVAVRLRLPDHVYATPTDIAAFAHRIEEGARALPGVTTAGVVESVPLWERSAANTSLQVEGRVVTAVGEAPTAMVQRLTPGGVSALGLRIRRGRTLSALDVEARRPVCLVNEEFVRKVLGGADPFATRVRMFDARQRWMEVVGVVADVKQTGALADPWPQVVVPLEQAAETGYYTPTGFSLVVRGATAETTLAGAVRRMVREVGPTVAIREIRALAAIKREALGDRSTLATLLTIAASLAVTLAAVGLYGVVTLWVGERRREIGLRLALGATAPQVHRLVLAQAGVPVLVGLAAGGAAALALTWSLRALLPGGLPADPFAALVVVVVLGGATVVAAALPAHRAACIDPAAALASE